MFHILTSHSVNVQAYRQLSKWVASQKNKTEQWLYVITQEIQTVCWNYPWNYPFHYPWKLDHFHWMNIESCLQTFIQTSVCNKHVGAYLALPKTWCWSNWFSYFLRTDSLKHWHFITLLIWARDFIVNNSPHDLLWISKSHL